MTVVAQDLVEIGPPVAEWPTRRREQLLRDLGVVHPLLTARLELREPLSFAEVTRVSVRWMG